MSVNEIPIAMSYPKIRNWTETEVIEWVVTEFGEDVAKCFEGKVSCFLPVASSYNII